MPRGKVEKSTWKSQGGLYPGIERDYWVYVPAQYNPAKPACLMVFQDGEGAVDEKGALRVPVVLDNLIQKGALPVTIAVFINPGVLKEAGSSSVAL